MQLTEQQLQHFKTFGFLIFRQLLSPEEMERYVQEFNSGLDSWIEGGKYDGKARHYAALMDEPTPFITSLIDDPRFADVAEQLVGKPVLGITTDGNYFVGDTRWHPDSRSLGYRGVKFCIYPDVLNASNGALRVIPGSHVDPFHSQIRTDSQDLFGVAPDQVPAFVFDTQPGDVIVFDLPLWHAAFHGAPGRRQGLVVYYEDPDTERATADIKDAMTHNQEMFTKLGREFYPPYWRSVDDPRHQRWVQRLDELGVLDTPGVSQR